MEVGLRVPLQATIDRPGTVVLPARLLLDVVRTLRSGDVSLELRPAEQDVEVVGGTARFHIRTLRGEDFPPLPEPGGDQVVAMPAPAFVDTIARVSRSASRDETRPILTGILVSASGDELRMVATDSYRLSVKETRLEAPLEGGFEANVPARAREELLEVVRRISLMAQKNAPLRLSFNEGEVKVSAQTPDVGEASEPLPIPFAGEPFEIGFNPDFLTVGLESAGADDVVLKLIS